MSEADDEARLVRNIPCLQGRREGSQPRAGGVCRGYFRNTYRPVGRELCAAITLFEDLPVTHERRKSSDNRMRESERIAGYFSNSHNNLSAISVNCSRPLAPGFVE